MYLSIPVASSTPEPAAKRRRAEDAAAPAVLAHEPALVSGFDAPSPAVLRAAAEATEDPLLFLEDAPGALAPPRRSWCATEPDWTAPFTVPGVCSGLL